MSVYLDYNATSPVRPFVKEAILRGLEVMGNPSSVHTQGREARRLVEEAREQVAEAVGVKPVQVIFTSGGTEANAQALQAKPYLARFISAIEHDSVRGFSSGLEILPVTAEGILDLSALAEKIKNAPSPSLLSVMMANNETGALQPVSEATKQARLYGVDVHTDAVQAFGKIPLNFADLGVDMMTISAHKVGGPRGVGALIVRENFPVQSLLRGGGQERSRRAGTENVAAIAGFGALSARLPEILEEADRIQHLRDQMEDKIQKFSSSSIYAQTALRLPNTSCVSTGGILAETLMMKLDLAGVSVSTGAACSSGKVTPSHVIQAMGFSAAEASRVIRVSLGWATTAEDMAHFLKLWPSLVQKT